MFSDKALINTIVTVRHNIALLQNWGQSIDYKTFSKDVMRRYAIQYAFIVMGEALKDIPRPFLEKYGPDIPWTEVIAFRNWLSHTYDDLPDPRIIDTINKDIPIVDEIMKRILSDIDPEYS